MLTHLTSLVVGALLTVMKTSLEAVLASWQIEAIDLELFGFAHHLAKLRVSLFDIERKRVVHNFVICCETPTTSSVRIPVVAAIA